MNFIKNTLNQVDLKDDTLYDIIYNLFFLAKLKDSEEDIKNGRVCTLEELEEYIKELEANVNENDNIW